MFSHEELNKSENTFFFDDVNYKDFPEPLYSLYRNRHIKSLFNSQAKTKLSSRDWYLQRIADGKISDWDKLVNHANAGFIEAYYGTGSFKKHMKKCNSQYGNIKVSRAKMAFQKSVEDTWSQTKFTEKTTKKVLNATFHVGNQ